MTYRTITMSSLACHHHRYCYQYHCCGVLWLYVVIYSVISYIIIDCNLSLNVCDHGVFVMEMEEYVLIVAIIILKVWQ